MKYAKMLVPISLVILMSCASTTGSSGTDAATKEVASIAQASAWDGFCAVAKPISWSSKDTDQTISEVKAHNALGITHCGWK